MSRELARGADSMAQSSTAFFIYVHAVPNGVLLPDATALHHTANALHAVERHGDNFQLNMARTARAVVLAGQDGPERTEAFHLFDTVREFLHQSLGVEFEVDVAKGAVFVVSVWDTATGRPDVSGN